MLFNIIGLPYQRNTYVEYAIHQILEPVVKRTEGLPLESRLNVLTLTVNNMMESWSDWILKQEIVFRSEQIMVSSGTVHLFQFCFQHRLDCVY